MTNFFLRVEGKLQKKGMAFQAGCGTMELEGDDYEYFIFSNPQGKLLLFKQ